MIPAIEMKAKTGNVRGLAGKPHNQLARILAMEFVFYTIVRNAYLNQDEATYLEHNYFKGQSELIEEIIDDLAGKMILLNCNTPGCVNEFLKFTRLAQAVHDVTDITSCMKEVLHHHERIIVQLREKLKMDNAHFTAHTVIAITQIIEQHERMAYTLRTHLQ